MLASSYLGCALKKRCGTLLLYTTLRAGQTCLAPLLRTAFRRHGCTERPARSFPNKYVIASTLCVGIVVSAPFLRWPCTDRLLNAALHNASVDKASNLDKTRNTLFPAFQRISALFSYVSAAVLRLPDTDRAERRHQTACLSPFLRVASRCFTFNFNRLICNQECLSGSFVSAAFLRRPGTGMLSRRNRTLSQHRDKRCE
jgi:hypothetical protein